MKVENVILSTSVDTSKLAKACQHGTMGLLFTLENV